MKKMVRSALLVTTLGALLCGGAMAGGGPFPADLVVEGDTSGYKQDAIGVTITKPGDYIISMDMFVDTTTQQILVDLKGDEGGVNLTLDGVNIDRSVVSVKKENDYALKNEDATLTLTLKGDNVLTGADVKTDEISSYGVWSEGDLTIQGNGSLVATGGVSADYSSYGIYCDESGMTIENGTVHAEGGVAYDDSCGIYSYYDITIAGGDVTTTGSTAKTDDSYGIYCDWGQVTIQGGTVYAEGSEAHDDSCGIYSYVDMTIAGGHVTAIGSTAKTDDSYGIYCDDGDVIIQGGTVRAESGEAKKDSYGIYSCYDMTIAGGNVSAISGTSAKKDSYGICSEYGDVTIKGEKTAVTATGKSQAIDCDDSLTVAENLPILAGADKKSAKSVANDGENLQDTLCKNKFKYVNIGKEAVVKDDAQDDYHMPMVDLEITITGDGELSINGGDDGIISVPEGSKRTFTVDGDVDSVIYDGEEIEVVDGKFTITIKGDSELEVIFSGEAKEEETSASPFTDLDEDDDAYEAVMALYENGIINGMTADTFEGETPINRAMITTMLHRVEGLPVSGISNFADVFAGMWYTNGINWAVSEGVVDGYPDGAFKPDQVITNQEMCKILRDYAIRCGVTVDSTLTAEGVADWASNAVAWALEIDMFEGNATDVVTRAQACEMIFAVLELIAE